MRAIGYIRVSTDEQGAGLKSQRAAIQTECDRRDWTVQIIEDVGISAKNLKRPGVLAALELLASGEAQGLMVAKLDRLSRSLLDFAGIMARSQQEGWALVALDCAVDTTTPAGEAMAGMLAIFAQFERRLISQRTKEALAVKRAQGVRLGRVSTLPESVRDRIRCERASGTSYRAIAALLNAEDVPTGQNGACWWASSVRAAAMTAEWRKTPGGCAESLRNLRTAAEPGPTNPPGGGIGVHARLGTG